jgi:Mce-associated membrane protein
MSDPTPADREPDDRPDAPSGRSPALVLAVSLAVVFALAAAVLGVVAAGRDDGDSRIDGLRKAAGEAGQAVLTYDYQHPKEHLDRVVALSTGSFKSDYRSQFEQGLQDLIQRTQSVSEGFVKDVYVSEIDGDSAEVIVRADESLDGVGGKRTVYDLYILFTMVHAGGSWKVDQVTDLNFPSSGAGGVSTSTTAPVP